jgi:N-methylhydantoinase B
VARDYRLLADEAVLSVRSDKRRFTPHGLAGGGAGAPSWNVINPGRDQQILPVLTTEPVTMHKNDVFRHVTAGSGGYGPATERDPDAVRKDVIADKVTLTHARTAYGVAITADYEVDWEGTRRLRAEMAAAAAAISAAPCASEGDRVALG